MRPTIDTFQDNARKAIADEKLQDALARLSHGFPERRRAAIERLPEFDALRDAARDIKNHVLDHLDFYLERFEEKVIEAGGTVHWARDASEAQEIIVRLCKDAGARTVTKSKSMIGEEIAINEHLEAAGIVPVETDMGEYIIQLRHEPPSHLIAPAIHLSINQVEDAFRDSHVHLVHDRPLEEPRLLLDEARAILRERFIAADVGITGANMLVAETGSLVIVTNEGNADLTMTLPRTHIAVASIEKIVPTLEDAAAILRVLARSATGQDMSVYTSVITGPKRNGDLDGPENFHVVLLDSGRAAMLGRPVRDMLRCIRCAACLNHCPVYKSIGGHAYGWVYSGPMGAALVPNLLGVHNARALPHASTLCGKCENVCPVRIPLPKLLRLLRVRDFMTRGALAADKIALKLWAFAAARPGLYRLGARIVAAVLGRKARYRSLPFAGGWTQSRDLPAPARRGFVDGWSLRKRNEK
ncbi:MAG: LutB/LldF family L-lactate oxidation iron-sulfur protein [Rhodospirillales bacterium]